MNLIKKCLILVLPSFVILGGCGKKNYEEKKEELAKIHRKEIEKIGKENISDEEKSKRRGTIEQQFTRELNDLRRGG